MDPHSQTELQHSPKQVKLLWTRFKTEKTTMNYIKRLHPARTTPTSRYYLYPLHKIFLNQFRILGASGVVDSVRFFKILSVVF